MAKIGTAHVEVKTVVSEESIEALRQKVTEAVAGSVDASLSITSTSLIAAAVRMHEALWRNGEWLKNAPDDVVFAYDDLQQSLKRLGLSL